MLAFRLMASRRRLRLANTVAFGLPLNNLRQSMKFPLTLRVVIGRIDERGRRRKLQTLHLFFRRNFDFEVLAIVKADALFITKVKQDKTFDF